MRTLLILSVLALAVAVLLAVLTVLRIRSAILKHKKLKWVENELDRAIAQLQSGDEEQILVALQMLSVLNDTSARLHALPFVAALVQNPNGQIARQAVVTEQRILAGLEPAIRRRVPRKREDGRRATA